MDSERFENHILWSKPTEVSDAMAAMEPVSDSVEESFSAIGFIASQLSGFRSGDARLFNVGQLDTANSSWQDVVTYLGHHRDNPTSTYHENARSHAEAWLQTAGGWFRPTSDSVPIANQARIEYETLIASYRAANTALRAQMSANDTAAGERQNALDAQVQSLKETVENCQALLASMQTTIKEEEAALQAALTTHAETFRAAQDKRGTDFTDWLQRKEISFDELVEPHLLGVQASERKGEEILEHIKSLGDQTDNAAGRTTGHILAENFKTSAKDELASGNWSFWVGVGLSISGVAWLVFVAIVTFSERNDFNWNWVSIKIALALALGGVATVLIRRGQHAQETSRAYKRTELELRAIGPFLSDIEDRKIAENAKVEFLQRTFGRSPEERSANVASTAADDGAVDKLMALASELVGKLPKSGA